MKCQRVSQESRAGGSSCLLHYVTFPRRSSVFLYSVALSVHIQQVTPSVTAQGVCYLIVHTPELVTRRPLALSYSLPWPLRCYLVDG